MVNLLTNLPKIVSRRKKRLGRGLGSGKGSKSGRGTTRHQKARETIPLHFEGGQGRIVKKFPLLRGKGRNRHYWKKSLILNFNHLNKFDSGSVISIETLIKAKLIDDKNTKIKILNFGKLEKKLTVNLPVSVGAKKAIEAAGGQVKLIQAKHERNKRKN